MENIQKVSTTSQIIIYQTEDGQTKLDVRMDKGSVWLTQKMMAELFQTTIPNINLHLKNIFEERELEENSTIKDFLIVQKEGNRALRHRKNPRTLLKNPVLCLIVDFPHAKVVMQRGDFLYCLYASQAQIQRFGFHFLVQRQEASAGIVQRDRWNFLQKPQYNNHQHIGRRSVRKQAE